MRTIWLATALVLAACGGSDADTSDVDTSQSMSAGDEAMSVPPAVQPSPSEPMPTARATVQPTEGNSVQGEIQFIQTEGASQLRVELTGLDPDTQHGFHIHETGDCSAPDGTSAGGHYNPQEHDHALGDTEAGHAGDLGNVSADSQGAVSTQIQASGFSVEGVVGRAVIVHASPDDGSQPTGGAGARMACGVIEPL